MTSTPPAVRRVASSSKMRMIALPITPSIGSSAIS